MEIPEMIAQMESKVLSQVSEFKSELEREKERTAKMQIQLDAVDLASKDHLITFGGGGGDPVTKALKALTDHSGYEMLRKSGRGRIVIETPCLLEQKSVISSGTIVPYASESSIATGGRLAYGRVRRLLRSIPIETGSVFFVRENVLTLAASPQVETASKAESTATFTAATAVVRTLAHYVNASKQLLDDSSEMEQFIRNVLIYGLEKVLEEEILFGVGTGEHFSGVGTTATSFNSALTAILPASLGWNRADILRLAFLQLEEAGYSADAAIVSPRDWALIEMTKSTDRNYLFTGALQKLQDSLWTKTIVPSPAMTNGSFLVGDFSSGTHLRMRQESTLDVSDENNDNFVKNLLTLRGELRAALVVNRPASFVTGSFVTSPA